MQEIYIINKLSTYNHQAANALTSGFGWLTIEECMQEMQKIKQEYTSKGYTVEKETEMQIILRYIDYDEYESYNHARIAIKDIILNIEKIMIEK